MDIFDRLANLNQKRKTNTPEEARVLEAMRSTAARSGTLGDLKRVLPEMEVGAIHDAVQNLVVRGKVRILPGNRWKLAE